MRKFGLIGFPLGHSFSRHYFTDKFLKESITDCSYENYQLESLDHIENRVFCDNAICGLNITIPFKSEIFKYVDIADDIALEAGAINVLKISRINDTRIVKGFNTDVYGFRESLVPHLDGINVRGAVILGTGGSSKAVVCALNGLGINYIQVSRRPGNGMISYDDLSDKILAENQLIINTTPLGMHPDVLKKPLINYNSLTSDHILYDLVYNPSITAFLKEGKERGCKTIGGLRMLHLQAEKSWEIWNDERV